MMPYAHPEDTSPYYPRPRAAKGHEDEYVPDSHICPECRDGKHRNCDGNAWCFIDDEPALCKCDLNGHPGEVTAP